MPGVLFRDLTPVFADGPAFRRDGRGLAAPSASDPRGRGRRRPTAGPGFDVVVGVEARGFLLAAAVALDAGVGRRAGPQGRASCPRERLAADYALEYGTATLELHADAIAARAAGAARRRRARHRRHARPPPIALVEQAGGVVAAVSVVIELAALGGRERIAPHAVHALWTT